MSKKLNFGIIGTGGMGENHLTGCMATPEANVIAIADADRNRLKMLAEKHGIKNTFSDYRALLRMKSIDAVCICLPNYLHAPAAIASFEAGKHVLCEKPPARNAKEAKSMVKSSRKAKKKLMFAFNQRFGEKAGILKRYIKDGELGEIYYAKTGWMRRKRCARGWFTDKEKSGGGPLIDIGVHMLDLTMWLMGFPKPVSVSAKTYSKFGNFNVEDLAAGFIKFDNDAVLILEVSEEAYIEDESIYSKLSGTKGGADMKIYPTECLHIYTDKNGIPVEIRPKVQPEDWTGMCKKEIRHFVKCINKDKEPVSSGEQGLTVMRIIDAIYESSKKGREVIIK